MLLPMTTTLLSLTSGDPRATPPAIFNHRLQLSLCLSTMLQNRRLSQTPFPFGALYELVVAEKLIPRVPDCSSCQNDPHTAYPQDGLIANAAENGFLLSLMTNRLLTPVCRTGNEKEYAGIPDLPNSGRLIELEFATVTNRKVRNQLRNVNAIERQVRGPFSMLCSDSCKHLTYNSPRAFCACLIFAVLWDKVGCIMFVLVSTCIA